MTYKTQTERTHDILLDRASDAEARATRAEEIATNAIDAANKAVDERDEALKALEVLRATIKATRA